MANRCLIWFDETKQIGYNLWNTDLYAISELLVSVLNCENLASKSTRQNACFWDFLLTLQIQNTHQAFLLNLPN